MGKQKLRKEAELTTIKEGEYFFYNKAGNAGLLWVIRVPFLIKRHLNHTPPNWGMVQVPGQQPSLPSAPGAA